MQQSPPAVVQFSDRHSAYAFVAELRRLGDLDELSGLRVHTAGSSLVVEVPPQRLPYGGLGDLAGRFGGRVPATREELQRLRRAIEAAKGTARETQASLWRSREIQQRATDAVDGIRATRTDRPPRGDKHPLSG